MFSFLKLLNAFYFKTWIGPFSFWLMPIFFIGFIGTAFLAGAGGNEINNLVSLIPGVLIINTFSAGFSAVPEVIIEIRQTVLMKRIGASKLSIKQFIFGVTGYYSVMAFSSIIWTNLLVGLIFGGNLAGNPLGWKLAFPNYYWLDIIYFMLVLLLALSIGLTLAAFINRVDNMSIISAFVYTPLSFLGGGIIPKTILDNSAILEAISWILPTKYMSELLTNSWLVGSGSTSEFLGASQTALYLGITLLLSGAFFIIVIRNLGWKR